MILEEQVAGYSPNLRSRKGTGVGVNGKSSLRAELRMLPGLWYSCSAV